MKKILWLISLIVISCKSNSYELKNVELKEIKSFPLEGISVRAMILLDNNIGFAGSKGVLGFINTQSKSTQFSSFSEQEFRSVASTKNHFFALTIGNPAILFKTENNEIKPVYIENNEKVFYDSMLFLDNNFGMAVGDPTENCLSIITTHDGGNSWKKMPCHEKITLEEGETLFAASNSNIASLDDKIWIITGGKKSRIFITDNQLTDFQYVTLPILQGESSQGAFSVAFSDTKNGIVMGGDFKNPTSKKQTAVITSDGGKTWKIVPENNSVGYVSCVKYFPNSEGKNLLATSPNGIFFSNDKGFSWKKILDEAFHSFEFIDSENVVFSGENRIKMFKIVKK